MGGEYFAKAMFSKKKEKVEKVEEKVVQKENEQPT